MKKISKLFLMLLSLALLLQLVACSNVKVKNNASATKEQLSIDDFKFDIVKTFKNEKMYSAISLTNNSKYDLLGYGIEYGLKNDAPEKELSVYDEIAKELKLEKKNFVFSSSVDPFTLIESGKSYESLLGLKGYMISLSAEQIQLLSPSFLAMILVGEDSKLYTAFYSFKDKLWSLNEDHRELNAISKIEKYKNIKFPKEKFHIIENEGLSYYHFISFGVGENDYDDYLNELRTAGFKDDYAYSSYDLNLKNSKGNTFRLEYDKKNKQLKVDVYISDNK
ncbi:MAG: hypothetical protein SPI53_05120 [Erysipelotrichaceae bacterium]|nr:hypothetical protein [Erysipelotrichaceae bacterium]